MAGALLISSMALSQLGALGTCNDLLREREREKKIDATCLIKHKEPFFFFN